MAVRIQLHRSKGWRKPPGAVVVARPSRWGNPWKVVELGGGDWTVRRSGRSLSGPLDEADARALAVALYEEALIAGELQFSAEAVRKVLGGHDLACWCAVDQPCHGDVLLDLANRDAAAPDDLPPVERGAPVAGRPSADPATRAGRADERTS